MSQTKSIIDIAAGGFVMTKTYEKAYKLMEKLAFDYHQMVYKRIARNPTFEIIQIDVVTTHFAKLTLISKKVRSMEV